IVGLILFAANRAAKAADERDPLDWRNSAWVWPWLGGLVVIGKFGRYGGDSTIPNWWDLVIVAVFSLVVYEVAVRMSITREEVAKYVAAEEEEARVAPELNLP